MPEKFKERAEPKEKAKEKAIMNDEQIETERLGYMEELKIGVPRLSEEEIKTHEEAEKRRGIIKKSGNTKRTA